MIDDKGKMKWTKNYDCKKWIFLCSKNDLSDFQLRMVKLTLELMVVVVHRLVDLVVHLVQVGLVLLVQHGLLPVVEVVLDQRPTNKRETRDEIPWQFDSQIGKICFRFRISAITWVIGAAFRGPPGLGGDNFGLSNALDSQSFFTGGGTGVPTVAIDTSPILCLIKIGSYPDFFICIEKQILPMIRSASEQAWYILNIPSRFCASSGLSSIIFDCDGEWNGIEKLVDWKIEHLLLLLLLVDLPDRQMHTNGPKVRRW